MYYRFQIAVFYGFYSKEGVYFVFFSTRRVIVDIAVHLETANPFSFIDAEDLVEVNIYVH